MDSFLRESFRVSIFETSKLADRQCIASHSNYSVAAVQREALADFQFSDGLKVSKGDWICIPWRTMMCDPQYFDQPRAFDALRFVKMNAERTQRLATPSRLADSTEDWLLWSAGRIRW